MTSRKEAEIWESLASMGNEALLKRDDVKEIPKLLLDGELPQVMVGGKYKGPFMQSSVSGVLVATNRRLVFVYMVGKGLFKRGEARTVEFYFDYITSIQPIKASFMGSSRVAVYIGANRTEIEVDLSEERFPFVAHVQQLIGDSRRPEAPEAAASGTASVADELQKLAALRDSGVLTEQEFQAQKQRLLGN